MIVRPFNNDSSRMPLPFQRECYTDSGMPVYSLDIGVSNKDILSSCEINKVASVSTFINCGGVFKGNYILKFLDKDSSINFDNIYKVYSFLLSSYCVDKKHIEFFTDNTEKVLFLQVNEESFSYSNSYFDLRPIYKEMTNILIKELDLAGNSVETVMSINPYNHYIPKFYDELQLNLTRESLEEDLEPVEDASHLLLNPDKTSINWIEFYTKKRPAPKLRFSPLRKVYLRAKNKCNSNFKDDFPFLDNLKGCALLRKVLKTTSWVDTDELSLLGGVCDYLDIRSFRELCVCCDILNPSMRGADKKHDFIKKIDTNLSCKEIEKMFPDMCSADCKVTSPVVLPYLALVFSGPRDTFWQDKEFVYYKTEYGQDVKVCSSYMLVSNINDPHGNYWGYTARFKDETYGIVKISEESKRGVLTNLELLGVKVFDKNLTYQYALSVGDGMYGGRVLSISGTNTAGWRDSCYSLPHRRNTVPFSLPFLFGPQYINVFRVSGIPTEYYQDLASMHFDSNVVLAMSAALSGPLLRLIEEPSFVVHFWSDNSDFRKQILSLVSHVWGGSQFVYSFTRLSEEIGEVAAAHNDNLILLNLDKSISQTKVHNLFQSLLSGSSSDAPYGASLRHAVLSVGTSPVKLKEQDSRIINIELKRLNLANPVRSDLFVRSYGHLGVSFINSLLNDQGITDSFHRNNNDFVAKAKGRKQVSGASIFAVLKTGLEAACRYNLLPVGCCDARGQIEQSFSNWATFRTETERDAVEHVLKVLEESYTNLNFGDSAICRTNVDYYGYRFTEEGRHGIHFPLAKFEALFCCTVGRNKLAELLLSDKILVPDKHGNLSSSHWIKGLQKSIRGYFLQLPRKKVSKTPD